MGRKIPGKKHKGVRDPEKQQAVRFNSIKHKINAPPSNADDQFVPKSLARIIELKEKVKDGRISLKRKRKNKRSIPVTSHPHLFKKRHSNQEEDDEEGAQKKRPKKVQKTVEGGMKKGKKTKFTPPPVKATPVFTQNVGETDKLFMLRVNKTCEAVMKEAAFENKYKVDIRRNRDTGEVEGVVKRPKDELEELVKKANRESKLDPKQLKKKKKKEAQPRLTKNQKRQKKIQAKKELKSTIQTDEFDSFQDSIKFGEIVHGPPTLAVPKRVESLKCAPRPGKKDLLLKSVLEGKEMTKNSFKKPGKSGDQRSQASQKNEQKLRKTANKVIDRKGKRKDLPNATRRQLDRQQQEVIKAYKDLKSQKLIQK